MKFPASRIIVDMHSCPMCAGTPLPIAWKGAWTVLTGMFPQARVKDMCVCAGPPPPFGGDPIITGAFNVLVEKMDRVREVCNAALSIRNAENIRVRQPLSKLTIVAADAEALAEYADIIRDEINVKDVQVEENVEQFADYKLQINFPVS